MRTWHTDGRIEADSRYGRLVLWFWRHGFSYTAAVIALVVTALREWRLWR